MAKIGKIHTLAVPRKPPLPRIGLKGQITMISSPFFYQWLLANAI